MLADASMPPQDNPLPPQPQQGRNSVLPGVDLLPDMHNMLSELGKYTTQPLRPLYIWATPTGRAVQRSFDNFYKFTDQLLDKAAAVCNPGGMHLNGAAPLAYNLSIIIPHDR